MDKWLSYDQISLIPIVVSTLESRAEADTSVQFGPLKLKVPIIAAPMPDVCHGFMAHSLSKLGALGLVHRFQEPWEQINDLDLYDGQSLGTVGAAIGLKDYEERTELLYDYGVRILCIDTANGANEMVHRALGTLKDKYPDIFIVTGNVASAETFYALQDWGADAIRVGIAGGSVCETRTETGVYSPMASVIADITGTMNDKPIIIQSGVSWSSFTNIYPKRKSLLIADGGIKTPADMCKALALGADVVMMGGALAGTDESPGSVIKTEDGKLKKRLAGAASYITQKESTGKKPTYVEGAETLIDYRGPVEGVINRFAAGLRSSMSYANARTLEEYRRNIKIVEIG